MRTVTMGISLYDCVSDDCERLCRNIYDKITRRAARLVAECEELEKLYGVPIVNKRISVTPVSCIGGSARPRNMSASPKRSTARRATSASILSAAFLRLCKKA